MLNMKVEFNSFPIITTDKIRYADTDRQGHVNNAVFSTFLETGRVEILYSHEANSLRENTTFVIGKLNLEYHKPLLWPGEVNIASGIKNIGNSSLEIHQKIFQNSETAASATTIIIQVDEDGRKSIPFSSLQKNYLQTFTFYE